MKILIIEDDPNKLNQIGDLIRSQFTRSDITERRSYQSGLKEALRQNPDLIILDMSMPTYDISLTEKGGRTRPYAGREILSEIKRKGLKSKVVVVTQFESFGEGSEVTTLSQLNTQLGSDFSSNYVSTVFYQPAESDWRDHLLQAVLPLKLVHND